MNFKAAHIPRQSYIGKKYYLPFVENKILVKKDPNDRLILSESIEELQINEFEEIYLGEFEGIPSSAICIQSATYVVPEDLELLSVRALYDSSQEPFFWLACRAYHLINWSNTHQYCGACGTKTIDKAQERAKKCPNCSLSFYPRISPAIIVAVTKKDELLMAHHGKTTNGNYTVLAGFVDVGESLEDCVRREVWEETKIKVKNINYFGSQPWAFPDSLMLAFTAEYESGEIEVDGEEITHAGWFKVDNMPQRNQGKISVSAHLIDWFIKKSSESL